MKTAISSSLKALFGAVLLSGAIVPPISAEPQGVVHSITGSGLTVVAENFFFPGSEGFTARQSISARQKADGTVGGNFYHSNLVRFKTRAHRVIARDHLPDR